MTNPCEGSIWRGMEDDPVHKHSDGTWWFYDEVWCHEHGPYASEEECDAKLEQYCREVLG